MHDIGRWTAGLLTLLVAGCAGGEGDSGDGARPNQGVAAEAIAATRPAPPPPPPPFTAADSAAALASLAAERDSVLAAFERAKPLTAREVAELRLDRNAEQIAVARELGVRAGGDAAVQALLRQGRLVELPDSTEHWILRDMDHSVAYATPDARAMLVELGRRFHARLDRLGLPRYRFKVTSVLRTDETQAALRRVNANASRVVSAHEFGTTVDISHERFAVPAPNDARRTPRELRQLREEMLEEVGKEHSRALQAELGRAVDEMKAQGALLVMMEDQQPVYHMTVARRLAAAGR